MRQEEGMEAKSGGVNAPSETAVVTREMIASVLSEDKEHRLRGKWPLVDVEGLKAMHGKYGGATFAPPLFVAYPPAYDIQREEWRDVVKGREVRGVGEGGRVRKEDAGERRGRRGRRRKEDADLAAKPASLAHVDSVRRTLLGTFPYMAELFEVAGPHLVVAGGSVVSACASSKFPLRDADIDADFFFVGLRDENEATELLRKLLAVFPTGESFLRNSYVLTVRCTESGETFARDYQFVLRLYESIDQVVGSFDLGPSGVGWSPWTGVFATPIAAFSLATGALIVDPSRRSKTFESRLVKYVNTKNFQLVVPSLAVPSQKKPIVLGWDSTHELQVDDPVGVRIVGNKPHRDPNYLVSDYYDDEGYGESGYRRRRGRRTTNVRADRNRTRDKYGLDHLERLLLRNIALASANVEGAQVMMTWQAKSANSVFEKPHLLGVQDLADLFYSRSDLSEHKFTLGMLRCYRHWYGEDFIPFIKARMYGVKAAGRSRWNRQVLTEPYTDRVIERVTARMSEFTPAPIQWGKWTDARPMSPSFDHVYHTVHTWYPPGAYDATHVGLPLPLALTVTALRLFHAGWRSLSMDLYRRIVRFYIMPHYWIEMPCRIWAGDWEQEDRGAKRARPDEAPSNDDDDEEEEEEDGDEGEDNDEEEDSDAMSESD